MLVTTIDLVELEPGDYLQWHSLPSAPGVLSDVPPSTNQRHHLGHILEAAPPRNADGWLAVTLDVPGPIQPQLLAEAFTALMRRHESLRCSFEIAEGRILRRVYPEQTLVLGAPSGPVPASSSEEARALLAQGLGEACDPARFPAVLFAAIDRPNTSTVICGFDHSAVDSLSIAIIIRELRGDYLARVAGQAPPQLAPVGSFLEYCVSEAEQPALPQDHPGLTIWRDFLAQQNGLFPSFPLDLGVVPGDLAPQRTSVFELLGHEDADAFEARCRSAGGNLFAGELTALATAVRQLGGPEQTATLTPMHTRRRPEWEEAVGWFVTNIPLVFHGGPDFAALVRRNWEAFWAALPAAQVPIGHVLEGEAGPFAFARRDVSMVSHLNYRRVFGPDIDPAMRATHISNTTVADDAQFWFSRTSEGLWLRVRYPDTDLANATMLQLFDQLGEILSGQS